MRETPLRFFFVVSGEHPTLPTAELVAILETLGVSYRVTGTAYKLVEIEANADRTGDVAKRGGFIEEAGIAFSEAERGTLEPGKRADMAVLNADPFSCDPDALREIGVMRTILGGKTVYH